MKQLILSLTAALGCLFLTSCLQNETTIRLNRDGSGTLVEETLLGARMLAMFEQMGGLGGADTKDPIAGMFSEDKAKARLANLGQGVTYDKSEPITKNGAKGNRTTYRFADINQLKVSTADGLKGLSPMAAQAPAADKPVLFKFVDGLLAITLPQPEQPDPVAVPGADAPDFENMGEPEKAMMQQMMGDLKLSLKIIIEPGIAETNATHREGNTITLLEMEMGKIFENPENFKKLGKIDQNNPAAAIEMMKGIPGMKFEAQKEITVKLD